MTWFRVDGEFHEHPKVLLLRENRQFSCAISLWLLAGCWCNRHATNGHVPRHLLRVVHGTAAAAKALVSVGLWEATPTGWKFKDWLDYQPSAEEIKDRREAWRERQQRRRGQLRVERMSRRDTPQDAPPVVTGGVTSCPIPIPIPEEILATTPPPKTGNPLRARTREERVEGDRALLAGFEPDTADPEPAFDFDRMQLVFRRQWLKARNASPNMHTKNPLAARQLLADVHATAVHMRCDPETLFLQALQLFAATAPEDALAFPFAWFAGRFGKLCTQASAKAQQKALSAQSPPIAELRKLWQSGGGNG